VNNNIKGVTHHGKKFFEWNRQGFDDCKRSLSHSVVNSESRWREGVIW